MNSISNVDMPLINQISQFFDETFFMWTQTQVDSDELIKNDVDIIYQMLRAKKMQHLSYKPVKKNLQPTDVLIKNSMHIMLVLKSSSDARNVALDYAFGQSTPKTSGEVGAIDDTSKNTDAGMIGYQKTVDGLSVRNLGLAYSNSILSVNVDATIAFGPVVFSLLDAVINLDFSKFGAFLANLTFDMISFSIEWLTVAFDRSSLLFADMFGAIDTANFRGWQGAVSIAYEPRKFAAAGFYETMSNDLTTAFIYAILNGPLFTLEFAQITGVTGGFEYNTNLKLPSAAAIPSFPFITSPSSALAPSSSLSPQEALKNPLMVDGSSFRNDFSKLSLVWLLRLSSFSAFEQ